MSNHPHEDREFLGDELVVQLDTTLPADPGEIDTIVERVLTLAAGMGCAAGKEFEIETSLREALANAIVHGCGCDPAKLIRCVVACDERRGMVIVVSDPGNGFDPAGLPDPTVGEQVYSDHGRGIFLINKLMDEVRFSHNGTRIHMRKS